MSASCMKLLFVKNLVVILILLFFAPVDIRFVRPAFVGLVRFRLVECVWSGSGYEYRSKPQKKRKNKCVPRADYPQNQTKPSTVQSVKSMLAN